ncbi:hypothetical protein AAVH_19387 [Aphelenchoides avenae]|nr:hypothetical protein AAVH_19387 [Aphelenchus avenae]
MAPGEEEATEAGASETGGDGAAGNGGVTSDAATGGGASNERTTEGRVEDRAESGAFAGGNKLAPSEVSGRGARSAVSDAQRWMRFSFALAAQLEQRAEALRFLEEQRSWVAEREPTTSSGPSMAQIAARLDEMQEDLRFPPALLDAILTEAVGGAFVDLSDDGGSACVDEATAQRESKAVTTSELGEEGSADVFRSVWEDDGTPEPEEQEVEASYGEATVPERTTSEAEASLGPVPDEWLIAARSWHKAKEHFGKRGKRVRERIGFRCPCEDCQQSDGQFRGQGFRAYTWHFGKYPFKFRFSCPAEGCSSDRTNRKGLLDHLKSCHELQMPDESSDEGGVSGGSEAELSGGGGVEGQSRAVSAERTEHSGGESTEAVGATTDGGDAAGAVVTGAAVLVAVAGGSGSGERSSKKKKASKRDREATNGGDGATASKKQKPDGGDSDFNPESDKER